MEKTMFLTLNQAVGESLGVHDYVNPRLASSVGGKYHLRIGSDHTQVAGPRVADRGKWGFSEEELHISATGGWRLDPHEALFFLSREEGPYSFGKVEAELWMDHRSATAGFPIGTVSPAEWERIQPLIQPRYERRVRLFDRFRARGFRALAYLMYRRLVIPLRETRPAPGTLPTTDTAMVVPLYDWKTGQPVNPFHATVDWEFRRRRYPVDAAAVEADPARDAVVAARYNVPVGDLDRVIDFTHTKTPPQGWDPFQILAWRKSAIAGRRTATVRELLYDIDAAERRGIRLANNSSGRWIVERVLPVWLT